MTATADVDGGARPASSGEAWAAGEGARMRQIARVEDALTRITRMVNGRAADRIRMERAQVDLTKPRMAMLRALYERGPMRVGELGALNHMDKGYVSRSWRILESKGYVEAVASPSVRSTTIALTPAGEEVYLRWRRVNFEIVAEVLDRWQGDELDALEEQLEELAMAMARYGAPPVHGWPS